MKESAIYWMSEGSVFVEKGQHKKAIECYDKVIFLNSEHQSAWYNKGNALSELNCIKEAILCYDKVLELNCKHEDALYNKGCALTKLEKYEDALYCFYEHLSINHFDKDTIDRIVSIFYHLYNYKEAVGCFDKPINTLKDKYTLFRNGRALFEIGKYEDSISCFDELLELDLQDDDLWLYKIWRNKGLGFSKLESDKEAISCFNKAVDYRVKLYDNPRLKVNHFFSQHIEFIALCEHTIECYDEIIKIDPHDEFTWKNKIFALEKSKQQEEAIVCWDEAIALNQDSICLWDTKGIILYNRQCYEDSMKCYDRIIEIDLRNIEAWDKKGDIFFSNLQDYEESIKCFNEIIKLNPNDIEAWGNKADALFKLQRYGESINCYDEVINLDSRNELAWVSKGVAFSELGQDSASLVCYNEALKSNPNIDQVNLLKGNALCKLERYDEAVNSYDNAIRVNPYDENAWNYKGFVLNLLESYEEAIECYEEAIKINPNKGDYYSDKALALSKLGRYEEAAGCIERNIELQPNADLAWAIKGGLLSEANNFEGALEYIEKINLKNESWWGLYGATLFELKRYEEAIGCYKKAVEINIRYADAWINLGKTYYKIGKMEDAINSFANSENDILSILIHLDDSERDEISEHVKVLLDNDAFFRKMTSNIIGNMNAYKDIYIISLLIMCRLSVSKERFVSHYTKKDISKKMLINSSNFRLNAIDKLINDPTEGFALIDFIYKESEIQKNQLKQDYIAFVGCFTFNHDSLNQFRLYGKEDGKEGTGVSVVLKNSFFYKKYKPLVLSLLEEKYQLNNKQTEDEKHSLFRCIYLDPKTGFVHSVGHKEEYLFYRKKDEYKEDFIDDIDNYKREIAENLQYIRDKMIILKNQSKALSSSVVSNLLLNLRYLTKHIAFKEEQECRIVEIIRSDSEDIKKDIETGKQFVEYLSIRNHVKKIYFGPKASNIMSYQYELKENGVSLTCEVSEQPFF